MVPCGLCKGERQLDVAIYRNIMRGMFIEKYWYPDHQLMRVLGGAGMIWCPHCGGDGKEPAPGSGPGGEAKWRETQR